MVVFREKLPAEDNERAGNVQAARCNSNPLLPLQDNQDFFSEMNAEKGPNSWGKGDACEKSASFVAHALQSV